MKKPDFLIIGAQKAGTTWLYRNLRAHPEVFLPSQTELMFFNKPDCESPSRLDQYFKHFEEAVGFKRVGEKTPGYFWSTDRGRSLVQPPKEHNPDIPGSVARVLGDETDFILSFRHPVDRAISAFGHHLKRGRISPDTRLRDVADRLGIVDMGYYVAHSKAWLKTFPRGRFHVMIFETDVVANPAEGYRSVCDFLCVDKIFLPKSISVPHNAGLERSESGGGISFLQGDGEAIIEREDIQFLLDRYEDETAGLSELWGINLDAWTKRSAALKREQFAD